MHTRVHMERSEDHFQKSVLSIHHASPRDQAQVARFGSKHLYLWSHVVSP